MPHRDLRFTHDYVEDAPPIVPVQGAVSGKAGGPVTDHSHTASGDGGAFDAANLLSDEDAEEGAVLSSDGEEGSEWRTLTLDSLADVNAPDPNDGDVPTWDDYTGEWVASPPVGGAVDAADVTYTPTVVADWDGSADPGDADDAFDQLAERVKDIEDAGGAPDASAVTYTPTTATDWDSDTDPGNVDGALDQLAERVDDLETETTVQAHVYNNATVSHLSSGNWVAMPMNSEYTDTSSMHDLVTNNSRITATVAGTYTITGNAGFTAHATGYRQVSIRLNGSTFHGVTTCPSLGSGAGINLSAVATIQMAVNDYVELCTWQNSGGALNIVSAADYSLRFSAIRIGA